MTDLRDVVIGFWASTKKKSIYGVPGIVDGTVQKSTGSILGNGSCSNSTDGDHDCEESSLHVG